MPTYEPDAYYATYHEQLKQHDGTEACYYRFVDSSETWMLDESIDSKADLIEAVTKQVTNVAGDSFTMTETENGFKFERYILWNADETEFTHVEPGQHCHHETYIVDIKQYVQATDPIKRLEERDAIRAECAKTEYLFRNPNPSYPKRSDTHATQN